MDHLALERLDLKGGSLGFITMDDDASITITKTSEVFAKGDVWSLSFRLNTSANAHVFGTSGDIHGSRLHDMIDKQRVRLWVDGVPLYLGYLKLGDEAEVDEDGNVDVTFESGRDTFDEMVEGAKANQVPLMEDIKIGMALLRKRKVRYYTTLGCSGIFSDQKTATFDDELHKQDGSTTIEFAADGEADGEAVQEYPKMVFPKGTFVDIQHGGSVDIDCINTDYPYDDGHPYCNVPLCYQQSGYRRKMEDGSIRDDYSQEPEAQRGYEYMPANRVNSAPNFYVIYWLRCLMKHLNIQIDENQMMDVEDLRRLFFVNTKCAYEEPKLVRNGYNERYGKYHFSGSGRIVPEYMQKDDTRYKPFVRIEESGFTCTGFTASAPDLWYMDDQGVKRDASQLIDPSQVPVLETVTVKLKTVDDIEEVEKMAYESENSILFNAYASKECFPDVDITDVMEAIRNGFGIRFLFDDNYQRVRIVLLRNIFRSEEVQDISCDIISDGKLENSIRGFRLTYGAGNDNTEYYYKGFADKLPHKKPYFIDDSDKHDYSKWDLNADYSSIIQKVSAFDKTCYVTPNNGNAYGIKVDKDAKRYDELHPSLLEFAGYMDAEDGDCTGKEETIETVTMGFSPAIMNDLNMNAERGDADHPPVKSQRFALFVDAEMRPRRLDLNDLPDPLQPGVKSYSDADAVYDIDKMYILYGPGSDSPKTSGDGIVKPGEFAIASDMYAACGDLHSTIVKFVGFRSIPTGHMVPDIVAIYGTYDITDIDIEGHINEGYRLYLQDNFGPNDDGVCPVEAKNWGLTLGIMRGSGSDAYVQYSDDPDDDENDTWDIVPGSNATAHPDTCDSYGNPWDYNGEIHITTREQARAELPIQFPDSNAPFYTQQRGFIYKTFLLNITDDNAQLHHALCAFAYSETGTIISIIRLKEYEEQLNGHSVSDIMTMDAQGFSIIIELDSTQERAETLRQLCMKAYGIYYPQDIIISNGVGTQFGRFSLKLRAEKPNPFFDPALPEGDNNRRYLKIDNSNLCQRGLGDQFYKEYSYWVRNARIWKGEVHMGLAQFLAIDMTKRAKVGDIIGFIRKMEFSASKKAGFDSKVKLEIMYI